MNQRGFTLIELLITVSIVAILSTIAVPSFSSFLAHQQLRSDLNEVVSLLSFARSEAIKRRNEVSATIDLSNDTWRITVAIVNPSETLRTGTGRQPAVSLEGLEETNNIRFDTLGTTINSDESCSAPCSITLSHSRFESKDDNEFISINSAGGIQSGN